MQAILVSVALLCGAASCYYYPAPVYNEITRTSIPSCELGSQLRYLPMYVVPERQLSVLQDYRTRYYTPSPAVVNFIGQNQPLPAVRVVLNDPIPVEHWKTFIEFPTSFTIFQDGYRLPFPVAAVFAPLPEYQFLRRPLIDVVYAVPSMPQESPRPVTTTLRPNVTILHFPETLAQPDVLYHEEGEDELGGRNPPVPIIPAGIVQSSAPTPDVTVFVNSKESPVLQLLRDEANRNRLRLRTVRT